MENFDFKAFRKNKKIGQKELQEVLNCSQAFVSAFETGRKNLSDEGFAKLVARYGDLSEFITPNSTEITPYTVNQQQQGVPYYDVDFIGGFDVVVNDQSTNPAYHINFAEYSKADCWVNVTGHSMEPTISHGDIVALRELQDWEDHILLGEIYAIVTNEYRTLKKVRKSSKGDDYLLIIPTNKDYDEQDIPKRIIRKVYQVLGAAKKLF